MNGKIDALIVGAGPVGLTMAAALTHHGLKYRVVEKAAKPTDKSKALVLWSRTLELFDPIGVSRTFQKSGHRVNGGSIYADNKRVVHFGLSGDESPFGYPVMIPQSATERILAEHLASEDITVERENSMSLVPPGKDLLALLQLQQAAFLKDMYPTHAARVDRLNRLGEMIASHAEEFASAISSDFSTRSMIEIRITETLVLQGGIRHAIRHLARWMKAQRVPTAMAYKPGSSRIMRQPLGVIGIISPWNYPLQLALAPLIGALAAGNRAMMKPSELTPAFSTALASAVAEHFASDEVTVVLGDAAVGKLFSALPFDHLVFTGSTAVGREVAQAAAKNLTPVTLELGGKSPAIIDSSCNLSGVIDRIAWGKLINAGQTCIAPDYMLVPRGEVDRFVEVLSKSMTRLYPKFRSNPDYSGIISERHLRRLKDLIDDARQHGAQVIEIEPLSDALPAGRQLAPTVLLNVNDGMRVMNEEIFGPILPIVPYDKVEDALAYINRHERPLALYWFGEDRAIRDRVLAGTIAGGVSINDTLLHIAQEELPFGGVGASGQGHYHGEYGFRQFSKEKPIFIQSRFSGGGIIRPPYKASIGRVLNWISRLT